MPLELPERYWKGFDAAEIILAAEAAAIFNRLITQHPDLTSPQLKELVATGNAISAPRYIEARQLQASLREELPRHLSGLDGILTVPAPGEAPEGLAYTGDASFCALWTMLGVPALTMPIARSGRGLPLGLQWLEALARTPSCCAPLGWSRRSWRTDSIDARLKLCRRASIRTSP